MKTIYRTASGGVYILEGTTMHIHSKSVGEHRMESVLLVYADPKVGERLTFTGLLVGQSDRQRETVRTSAITEIDYAD